MRCLGVRVVVVVGGSSLGVADQGSPVGLLIGRHGQVDVALPQLDLHALQVLFPFFVHNVVSVGASVHDIFG